MCIITNREPRCMSPMYQSFPVSFIQTIHFYNTFKFKKNLIFCHVKGQLYCSHNPIGHALRPGPCSVASPRRITPIATIRLYTAHGPSATSTAVTTKKYSPKSLSFQEVP